MAKNCERYILRIGLVITLVLFIASCSSKQNQGNSTETIDSLALEDSQDMESVRAFVERFYKEWGEDILEYDYPKQHITPRLLKFLADSYEFECEGECLATWMFFYEGGGDVGEMKSRQITARDENHVLVENKYVNYEYDVLLTVIKDGDTFKIDSLQQERSEYIDMN